MKNYLFLSVLLFIFIGCTQKSNSQDNKTITNQEKSRVENAGDTLLIAVFNTSMGKFEAQLFPDKAPKAVENFTVHAEKEYYKGVIFHRVIPNFMIQGGDPTGTGRDGESIWGKPFEDEINSDLQFDTPGILAMANAGPNTNGSQFFITVAQTPWLNGHHTIFGKIISGMSVVNSISEVKRNARDRPLKDVVIEDITIEKRAQQ
jgi:cyclophilin family peptidyl-prolyl cis-trans isomerase